MVGHSGAGKTSFMAGLYKYVGEDQEGYGIASRNDSQKRHLKKIANDLSKGKYPAGTDIQQKYSFAFTVAGYDLMPFNWIDYRGGILLSDEPEDEDMDKFMKAIANADALVVFLDGEKLIQPGSKWNMEYDILISCIENSLSVSHSSLFPISFVITKCDLIPNGATFHGLSRFDSLFSQIGKSNQVEAMLVQCAIKPDFYYIPFFVLAYSIYRGTPIYQKRCDDAYAAARRRADNHRPTSIIGHLFAGAEQILSTVASIVDLEWETEWEKTWAAESDAETQKARSDQLKACAKDLREKLNKWSEDDMVTFF